MKKFRQIYECQKIELLGTIHTGLRRSAWSSLGIRYIRETRFAISYNFAKSYYIPQFYETQQGITQTDWKIF